MMHFDVAMSVDFGDVHLRPITIANQTKDLLKIDRVHRVGNAICVVGWSTAQELSFQLATADTIVEASVRRCERLDVGQAIGREDQCGLGFVAVATDLNAAPTRLFAQIRKVQGHWDIAEFDEGPASDPSTVSAIYQCLTDSALGSEPWKQTIQLIADSPPPAENVAGSIDHVFFCTAGGFVAGWALASNEVSVWLEDDKGRVFTLEAAFRWQRQDVVEAPLLLSPGSEKTGFLCALPAIADMGNMRLAGCSQSGRFVISAMEGTRLQTELKPMAKALFDVNTPRQEIAVRARSVDLPLLTSVQQHLRAQPSRAKVEVRRFGNLIEDPKISVIIPLYDRFDMVENQLLSFAEDQDFFEETEVIFVNDDPRHRHHFYGQCETLASIIGVPFTVVDASENLGFSSANNLGAKHARAETLIFMNSDVFPIESGWSMRLQKTLNSNLELGILSPKLSFPDGSIQHIGMEPCWREAFGVWTNRHPMMGFDPDLAPKEGIQMVPLVSGACVALRRADLDAIGGWSTDYLIGDFEDSDLCLALRSKGLKAAYDPAISLTHLERQSMPGMGEPTFREQITFINAARYNLKWSRELRTLSK